MVAMRVKKSFAHGKRLTMHAKYEYNAGVRSVQKKQYTIRNLSPQLDARLREQAQETGKSLNELVLDTLKRGAGLAEQPILYHDLDHLMGQWHEDCDFDEAISAQDQVDPSLWS